MATEPIKFKEYFFARLHKSYCILCKVYTIPVLILAVILDASITTFTTVLVVNPSKVKKCSQNQCLKNEPFHQ